MTGDTAAGSVRTLIAETQTRHGDGLSERPGHLIENPWNWDSLALERRSTFLT